MTDRYKTIRKGVISEIIIKKSKFIGACYPVANQEEAEEIIHAVQKEHYKATHNTFAYVLEPDASLFKYSDDGEPSQTAGKPIYDTIGGMELTNILVMVTRYFGGIKLGTGGLTRAYGQSAKEALEAAEVILMQKYRRYVLVSEYGQVGAMQHYFGKFDHRLVQTDYLDKVTFHIDVAIGEEVSFLAGYTEMTNGQEPLEIGEIHYEEKV